MKLGLAQPTFSDITLNRTRVLQIDALDAQPTFADIDLDKNTKLTIETLDAPPSFVNINFHKTYVIPLAILDAQPTFNDIALTLAGVEVISIETLNTQPTFNDIGFNRTYSLPIATMDAQPTFNDVFFGRTYALPIATMDAQPTLADITLTYTPASGTSWDGDIANMTVIGSYTPTQVNQVRGMTTSPDGLRHLVWESGDSEIFEYEGTDKADPTTYSYDGSTDIGQGTNTIIDIKFNGDGSRAFVVVDVDIIEYSLTTNYSFLGGYTLENQQNFFDEPIAFSSDGTILFGLRTNAILSYDLASAYDFSVAIPSRTHYMATTGYSSNRGIFLDPTDEYLYFVDRGTDRVVRGTMSTPGDLSTFSITDFKSISAQCDNPFGLAFPETGDVLYVADLPNKQIDFYDVPALP